MVMNFILWVSRMVPAIIMVQTLRYKLTGDPLSVHIFSALGIEPWGRIGTGLLELVASILLVLPAVSSLGAFLGMGLMAGAILSHLFFLGIDVQGDGGRLFGMAIIVFVSSSVCWWLHRDQFFSFVRSFLKKS